MRQIAFVLLENPVPLNEATLVDALRQRHPNVRWETTGLAKGGNDPIMIRGGDHLVTVMQIDQPLPRDENLWKRATRIWPEARDAAARHRAHLVVSEMGAAEKETDAANLTVIESARLTTAVAGALFELFPGCLAAAWNCKNVRSRRLWLEESPRAFNAYPDHPFALWVDVVPFSLGQSNLAVTLGLSPFVEREIEFEAGSLDRSTVVQRVAGSAFYLIEHGLGAALKSGKVFEGDSESDRFLVLHRKSRFTGAPVVSFSPVQDTSGRLKSYPIIPASIARDHPLLVMLGKAGLFDVSRPENQFSLHPDHFVSEVRIDSYDRGVMGVLSGVLASDAYAEADPKARRALTNGDVATARSLLTPFAEEIGRFLEAARLALTLGDLHMFQPRPLTAPL